jgi:hypothetical protein
MRGLHLEDVGPRVESAWRTHDGITHTAWRENAELFAGVYTSCEPLKLRWHFEGQGIGFATPTCVACILAR